MWKDISSTVHVLPVCLTSHTHCYMVSWSRLCSFWMLLRLAASTFALLVIFWREKNNKSSMQHHNASFQDTTYQNRWNINWHHLHIHPRGGVDKRKNIYIAVRLQAFKSAGICHKYVVSDEKTILFLPLLFLLFQPKACCVSIYTLPN